MQIRGQAQKVTIYIGESDKWEHKPLYMAILEMLKTQDCAGATVTRAVAGFGAHSRIHTASLVDLSSDLPLVIEWVDNPARIDRVMPRLQAMVTEGLITVQDVEVIKYSHRRLRQLSAGIPVQDIMTREVRSVQVDTPLLEVIELLLDKVFRALPVVDKEQHVVGIVTEGNLLRHVNLMPASAQQHLTRTELVSELQRLRRIDHTVAKIMTPNPITVTAQATVSQAVQLMIEHGIKRLPVVDTENKLIGIVSRVDVLRALCQPPLEESPRQKFVPGQHVQVHQVMMTNVPTVQANTSLVKVVGLLVSHVQRRVVVVDPQNRAVGIITDGDLISRATATERSGIVQALSRRLVPEHTAGLALNKRTAAEVMTTPLITVTPQTTLPEALHLLLENRIKRLPVVDQSGKLVGLVGRGGILQALAAHEPDTSSPTG